MTRIEARDYEIVGARIVKLRAALRYFTKLLEDPHPGLFTWLDAVERQRIEINAILDGDRDT